MRTITAPSDSNIALRSAIYQGELFRLPGTPASCRLVDDALGLIERELEGDIRTAQFRFEDADHFRRIGRLRKQIFSEERFRAHVRALLVEHGFDPARTAFDPIRLRAVTHRGFENPRAAPVYFAHRDTWYANSQAVINWWLPLHDVTAEETFVFYTDCFDRPVPNNSELFDYDAREGNGVGLRIGWQDPNHGRTQLYPAQVGVFEPGRAVGFAASAAEVILFAGSHFHQTRKNLTGQTRFSVDFRTVDLDDHTAGHGAPNVDNRSTGSAMRAYIHPGD